ncbi:SigE family RNA polymerase sigma factor [Nocardioides sp. MH1]|uniref:SigE family RNA polymerase sigma factor n=1 Tax=Nocardioides sp. MH1 TaxID=3242490 RepID=UPI00352047A8
MDETARAAYAEFATARWGALVRAGVVLGCDHHAAEDLAQATLVRCFVKWSQVERAHDRDAYVARVLVNLHRQGRRRRWRDEVPSEAPPERLVESDAAAVDDLEGVRRALLCLTPEQREAVVLRVHLQLPEREAAAVLGVPPGTVKSRLSRALSRLATEPTVIEMRGGRQ